MLVCYIYFGYYILYYIYIYFNSWIIKPIYWEQVSSSMSARKIIWYNTIQWEKRHKMLLNLLNLYLFSLLSQQSWPAVNLPWVAASVSVWCTVKKNGELIHHGNVLLSRYSVRGADCPANINQESGQLLLIRELDRELQDLHICEITAQERSPTGGSPLASPLECSLEWLSWIKDFRQIKVWISVLTHFKTFQQLYSDECLTFSSLIQASVESLDVRLSLSSQIRYPVLFCLF